MKLNQTYFILDTENDLQKFVELLTNSGYTFHHSAKAYGHISKAYTALYAEYSGVFGEGITIHYPTDKSCKSSSNHRVDYYLIKEG